MIGSLTQEQVEKFPEYVDKWIRIGFNTEPTDMIDSVKNIIDAYKSSGLREPSYFIGPVDGPYEASVAELLLNQLVDKKTEFENAAHLNSIILEGVNNFQGDIHRNELTISNQIFGNQDYWLSYYDYFQTECNIDLSRINPLKNLANVCGWWTPLQNVAIIQNRPSEIHRDSEGRLHNESGPAVCFTNKDSLSNVYSIHGVRVPKKVIYRQFNVNDIESESNVEVRRVMIELYGQSKYLIDSGAQIVHTDDFGTLYRKEIPNDEPLMMVKVVNSTVEADGTYKDYFIRVSPNAYGGLTTARAAVASTWRNNDPERSMIFENPEDYDPDIET